MWNTQDHTEKECPTRYKQQWETYTEDGMLVFVKWKEKCDVALVSTLHDDTMLEKRRTRLAHGGIEVVKKSKMVEDYNMHMAGVGKYKVYRLYMKNYYTLTCMTYSFYKYQLIKIFSSNLASSVFSCTSYNLISLFIIGDQTVMYYGNAHRSVQWWKGVFFTS